MLGAAALSRRIAERAITVADVVEASLSAIATLDPALRAFITVDSERARQTAAAHDARLAADNGDLPPQFGVPVAIKDVTPTAGLRTTFGSRLHAENIPARDALSVARLTAAGAIVIGKTNTPEFAFGAQCVNSFCGRPTRRAPRHRSRHSTTPRRSTARRRRPSASRMR
jgi:amidase